MVENWKRFTDLGLEIAVTELDVRLPVDGQDGGSKHLLEFQYVNSNLFWVFQAT